MALCTPRRLPYRLAGVRCAADIALLGRYALLPVNAEVEHAHEQVHSEEGREVEKGLVMKRNATGI